jgi:peptidoglycan hydrolase-like protein with peptidoglycan-binding domain
VERWFQNTRGLVIVILAVATCALLLAVEPSDGFPSGVAASSDGGGGGGGSGTVTTGTTTPGSTTTTLPAKPTLQQGSADTANVTILQQQLNAHGYNVGTPDGSFGPGTEAQVVKFQQDNKISPADGVVNQATWNALLASPSSSSSSTTTTTKAP